MRRAAASVVVALILGGLGDGHGLGLGLASAGPIDPFSVTSLGAFASAPGGDYQIQSGGSAPTLTSLFGPSVSYTGTIVQDAAGNSVAVFDFTSFTLAPGAFLQAVGSLPVAILSRGDLTVGGVIDASGSIGSPGAGPGARPTNASAGASVFFNQQGLFGFDVGGSGGGGFGGAGGPGRPVIQPLPTGGITTIPGGAGGPATGDLSVRLTGGTAGAPGGLIGNSYGGGGGIELVAAGALTLQATGAILADGAGANPSSPGIPTGAGAGGGSGGGVFLFAYSGGVSVQGPITARGGYGGAVGESENFYVAPGGQGGGGRVLIEGYNATPVVGPGLIDVSGYTPGTITIASVPEPASLALLGTGLAAVACLERRRRRVA